VIRSVILLESVPRAEEGGRWCATDVTSLAILPGIVQRKGTVTEKTGREEIERTEVVIGQDGEKTPEFVTTGAEVDSSATNVPDTVIFLGTAERKRTVATDVMEADT